MLLLGGEALPFIQNQFLRPRLRPIGGNATVCGVGFTVGWSSDVQSGATDPCNGPSLSPQNTSSEENGDPGSGSVAVHKSVRPEFAWIRPAIVVLVQNTYPLV